MELTRTGAARRLRLPLAALLLVAMAGCHATGAVDDAQHGHQQPIHTTEADWKGVTDTLGRTGTFGNNNTVYRIALPRTDLHVVAGGRRDQAWPVRGWLRRLRQVTMAPW
jgi:hypothetical protein